MSGKVSKIFALLFKVLVAASLVGFLIHSGRLDPQGLIRLMTPLNVLVAFGLVGFGLFLAAWRWIVLLEARGIHLPLGYGMSLYLIGTFFNYALPGAVSGDLVRAYYLIVDHPDRRLDSFLSVLIDRVLGLYSFFILSLVAVIWDFDFVMTHEQIRWVASLCFFIFLGMTIFFAVVFSTRLSRLMGLDWFERRLAIVHKLVLGTQNFGRNRKAVAISVALSLLTQLVTMIFFYQIAVISGEASIITWKAVLFSVPLGFLVTAIPIAPAGIGVGQVAFLYLFQAYSQSQTQFGATAITAFQITLACWALLGAVFYLRRRKPNELDKIDSVAAEMV